MTDTTNTRPCENCGTLITKTNSQQSQRKYWTCNASCANQLRIARGNVPSTWKANPYRGQKDTRPCVVCGNPVTRHLSEKSIARDWTCSRTCSATNVTRKQLEAGTWFRPSNPRRGMETPCEQCGTPVYGSIAAKEQGKGRFCSRRCTYANMRKDRTTQDCTWCGKPMELKPSQAGKLYCSKACDCEAKIKRPMDRIHNGRRARKDKYGYIYLWEPDHPNKSQHGWQPEHRMVVEASIGRYLTSDEQVDHINNKKDDNRIENLQVLSVKEHTKKTVSELLNQRELERSELEEYRLRYGLLSDWNYGRYPKGL